MKKVEGFGVWIAGAGAAGFLLGYLVTFLRQYSHFFALGIIAGVALWILGHLF